MLIFADVGGGELARCVHVENAQNYLCFFNFPDPKWRKSLYSRQSVHLTHINTRFSRFNAQRELK